MHVTVGSGVLSVSSSGADVVLARFPASGSTLSAFSLTPSAIKSIAIPNNIQEWPTTALNGCTNLETITVYGHETESGAISLTLGHNLRSFSKLTVLQLPSTVTEFTALGGSPDWIGRDSQTLFPKCLASITLPKRLKVIGDDARPFLDNQILRSVDFSKCTCLTNVGKDGFIFCGNITSMDFSNCTALTLIDWGAFRESSLTTIIIPPSVTIIQINAFLRAPIKTLIWKGRSERLPVVNEQCPSSGISTGAFGARFDELVSSGQITEIFVP